jgi:rhodanese-related sulfurtransferase
MKRLYLIISMMLVCITLSFSAFADTPEEAFKSKVAEAKKVVKIIKPAELMEWIKADKNFVLVDVREKNEVEAGKIEAPTNRHFARGLLDVLVFKGKVLKPEQTVVIYCKKGTRGLLAAKDLADMGFTKVYNLAGGIHAWMDAGLPITNSLGTFKTVPYELTGCGEK